MAGNARCRNDESSFAVEREVDRILTASAARGTVSLVAGITTGIVREARGRHDLAPTASAAAGRLLTAASLFGATLTATERITLQISADGPIGSLTADAWLLEPRRIGARVYVRNPKADLPLNARGKFDVAGVVGAGHLQLTKSYEIGQPYSGVVPIVSGEIGEDIAHYLASSQQIPSVVALGVLADPSGIAAAGGVIAQIMPGADDATIAMLEKHASSMTAVTTQIMNGADPEALMRSIVGDDLELKVFDTFELAFDCRCTQEKVELALLGLGKDELEKIAREQSSTEALCDFCARRYELISSDVERLAARL